MDKKIRVWLYVLLFLLIASLIMCVIFKLTLDDVNGKYMALLNDGADAAPQATVAVTPGAEDTGVPATQEPVSPTEEPTLAGYTEAQVLTMADELDAANARIAELEGREAELETANARIAELEGCEVELETANARIAELEGEAAALEDEVAGLEARVAELETGAENTADAAQQTEELDAVKTELDAARAELDAAKAELDTAKAELDTAKAELDTAKAELDTAKAELDSVAAQRDEALAALEEADAEIASLEGELDMYRAESSAGGEFGDAVRVKGTEGEFEFTNSSAMNVVCRIVIGDEELYVSGMIAPGETLTAFTAAFEPEAGSHEAMLVVESIRDDGSVASRMSIPVTVIAE